MSKPVIYRVQKTKRGQWTLTIPARFASVMDLNPHDEMEIQLIPKDDGCELVVRKVVE